MPHGIHSFSTPRRGDGALRWSDINALMEEVRRIGRLVFSQNFRLTNIGSAILVDLASDPNDPGDLPYLPVVPGPVPEGTSGKVPLDTSAWRFGYGEAAGAVVPVTEGTLFDGTEAYEYAGGNVTVSNEEPWIGYEIGSGTTVTVKAGARDDFRDDPEYYRGPLHKFRIDANGRAWPVQIAHLGDASRPGNFAPPTGS